MDKTIFERFTQAEQAFAISQLDPYHDTPYRLTGAPSDQNSDSVIITVNQEIVLTAASFGLPTAPGGKWDMHVAALPVLQQATYYSSRNSQSTFYTAGGSADESPFMSLWPLTVSANASGLQTFVYDVGDPAFVGIGTTIPGYQPTTASVLTMPRNMRQIGASFEVVDESPTLYQQGAVTVYQRPSCINDSCNIGCQATQNGGTANVARVLNVDAFIGPPNRISQATILPSSKTWKAKDGAYVISRSTTFASPFYKPDTNSVAMLSPIDPIIPTSKNSYFPRELFNAFGAPGSLAWYDSFNAVLPFNVAGAYFTGLNSEFGTYRIRSKLIYEIIPDPADTSLVTLATPTLPRNSIFEDLLAEAISKLPPGVPQSWNPKGEAWKQVLRAVKGIAMTAAPSAAAMLANTFVPGSGIAAGAATQKAIDTYNVGKQMQKVTKLAAKPRR